MKIDPTCETFYRSKHSTRHPPSDPNYFRYYENGNLPPRTFDSKHSNFHPTIPYPNSMTIHTMPHYPTIVNTGNERPLAGLSSDVVYLDHVFLEWQGGINELKKRGVIETRMLRKKGSSRTRGGTFSYSSSCT